MDPYAVFLAIWEAYQCREIAKHNRDVGNTWLAKVAHTSARNWLRMARGRTDFLRAKV